MGDTPITALARVFEAVSIPYVLIGGHAVNVWLEPRFTADLDVAVEAGPSDVERLADALARGGYTRERIHGAEQPSGPDFVRFVSANREVVLEVQVAKTRFQREVIQRARVSGDGVRVATVEDLIVMKLIADRAKDRVDLLGLAALSGVDWAYVERWAVEWGVADRLRRLRERA